jgi:hypothetical protein
MRARAYLSIQGEFFNAADFQRKAGGRVRRKKHSGAPLTNLPLEDWASGENQSDPHEVDAGMSNLLTTLVPLLSGVAKTPGIMILAHVVLEFDEGEEPVGLYFSEKTIQMLSRIGAAIDVDAVPLVLGKAAQS